MNGFKIPEVENLGRVLTKEELKAIIGGAEATVHCECKITKVVYSEGEEYTRTVNVDPSGRFDGEVACRNACNARCSDIPNCVKVEALYRYDGSGS